MPPRTGLLLYLRTPNGTGAAAGKYVATAGSASIFAALGSDWYTDVATPKALTAAEILALASVNDYHILFSLTKGLAVYDPYTTAQADIDKAHAFYRVSIYADDVPTAFFNGIDTTGMTSYTGGPTYAPDHLGVLRSPGAGLPALQGMRLATTVAEGAVLGPDIAAATPPCDAGWVNNGDGTSTFTGPASGNANLYNITNTPPVVGKTYKASYQVISNTFASNLLTIIIGSKTSTQGSLEFSATASNTTTVINAGGLKNLTGSITVGLRSFKEVIPTYYDTTITGEPILPSVEQKTRTSGTVLDGTELGPELCGNGGFDTDTVWKKEAGWSIDTLTGKAVAVSGADSSLYQQLVTDKNDICVLILTVELTAGTITIRFGSNTGQHTISSPGTHTLQVTDQNDGFFKLYKSKTFAGTVDSVSIKKVLPAFTNVFTPSTTFKKYTRTNPATDMPGYLCEPARTNKVTCQKANPVDLSGLTKSGDAAAVLSVVDDTAALTAAGLIGICNSGKVYKLDNSLGVVRANALPLGITANINPHSLLVAARVVSGAGGLLRSSSNTASVNFTNSAFNIIKSENFVPSLTSTTMNVSAEAGAVIHFILPQLEEGPFATSPIAKLQDGTDPLTAITRAGTVLTYPTSGKIRSNDIAFKLSAVPRGARQSGYLWGSYTDASNFTYLSINPYDITFKSVVNGFSQDLAIADYTHKADTPFEVILCKSTKGSQLLVREYSAGVWQPWVRGGFSVASDNLVVGSTYTLGAFNNAGQFAGNISELDALLIPAGIANPVAWVESQWGVNDAVSNPVIFSHTFTGLTLLDGVLRTKSASDSVTINWGDGTSNTYSGTADTAFTHTYASATTVYNVTYTASDNSVLTRMGYTDRAGSKVGGLLSLPAGMTYFICRGSNTLSGVLSLPASMTLFNCSGSNTLSGALSLPAGMTYFKCDGSNTLSGVLSLPAGMTFFSCAGFNTLSGVLSLPAGMTFFYCAGFNTFSGYTPSTKASNQNRFSLDGLNTLSAANVDAIIQDYAAAGGTWTGDKVFSMTVLAASNRTAASDAAWATLGTKGLVTRTITLR